MKADVHTLPANGRRGISRLTYAPLARVECCRGSWGLF